MVHVAVEEFVPLRPLWDHATASQLDLSPSWDKATSKTFILFSFKDIQRWTCWCVLDHCHATLPKSTWAWWDILPQDFLVERRIHGSINRNKSSRSWSGRAAKMFFWHMWDEPSCSFWSAMVFALRLASFLLRLFLIVQSWRLILTDASEAGGSLDALGSSWMSCPCVPGVILVGCTVPTFLHFWIWLSP